MSTFKILPNVNYIIRKPKRSFCVFLEVDVDFPLSPLANEGLENLKKVGFDVFFLFPTVLNPAVKKINPLKFTTLYEGVGFKVIDGEALVHSVFQTGEYIATLTEGYVGVSYERLSTIGGLTLEELTTLFNKFITISSSSIASPVLKIQRREPEELWEDYKADFWDEGEMEVEIKLPEIDYLTGAVIPVPDLVFPMEVDKYRSGCTHTSQTILPYLQTGYFTKLWKIIDETEGGMGWYMTWATSEDPKEFLSSAISHFELPHLDQDPLTLSLNPTSGTKTKKKDEK